MTFNETQTAYLNALKSVDDIVSSINGSYNLGSGYKFALIVIKKGNNMDIMRKLETSGNFKDMPDEVIKKYANAIILLEQWIEGTLSDFPDFKHL